MRAIDRGTRGINTVMNALLFHLLPTALEIGLVCGIFAWRFGALRFALANMLMCVCARLFVFSVGKLCVVDDRGRRRQFCMGNPRHSGNIQCVHVSGDAVANEISQGGQYVRQRRCIEIHRFAVEFGDGQVFF